MIKGFADENLSTEKIAGRHRRGGGMLQMGELLGRHGKGAAHRRLDFDSILLPPARR